MAAGPAASGSCAERAHAQVDLLLASVQSLGCMQRLSAQTVVMNPPFGTRAKGADLEFLHAALQVGSLSAPL